MIKKLTKLSVCAMMVWVFSSAFALEVQVTQAQLVDADSDKRDRCHQFCGEQYPTSYSQYHACMNGCMNGPD